MIKHNLMVIDTNILNFYLKLSLYLFYFSSNNLLSLSELWNKEPTFYSDDPMKLRQKLEEEKYRRQVTNILKVMTSLIFI